MKNNKMTALAALALAGLLALAGCGSNGNSAKTDAKSQATEQKADDKADDKGGDKGFEEVPVEASPRSEHWTSYYWRCVLPASGHGSSWYGLEGERSKLPP